MSNPPFDNCKYKICDLPGQCRTEGKCHHPEQKRIADLERQLARIPKKWRQLYETEKLTRKLAEKQLAAARQTLRQTLRQLAEEQREIGGESD